MYLENLFSDFIAHFESVVEPLSSLMEDNNYHGYPSILVEFMTDELKYVGHVRHLLTSPIGKKDSQGKETDRGYGLYLHIPSDGKLLFSHAVVCHSKDDEVSKMRDFSASWLGGPPDRVHLSQEDNCLYVTFERFNGTVEISFHPGKPIMDDGDDYWLNTDDVFV